MPASTKFSVLQMSHINNAKWAEFQGSLHVSKINRDGISTFQPGGLRPSPSASQGISGPHKPNKGAPGCPSPFPHSRLPSKSPATHLLTLENSTRLGTLKERESNPLVFFPKMRLTWTLSRFQSLENPWRFLGGRGGSRLGSL